MELPGTEQGRETNNSYTHCCIAAQLDITIHEKVVEVGSSLDSGVSESCDVSPVRSQCCQFSVLQFQLRVNNVPVLTMPHEEGEGPAHGLSSH